MLQSEMVKLVTRNELITRDNDILKEQQKQWEIKHSKIKEENKRLKEDSERVRRDEYDRLIRELSNQQKMATESVQSEIEQTRRPAGNTKSSQQ
jgi:predicted phage gp36 major capsid-like protein